MSSRPLLVVLYDINKHHQRACLVMYNPTGFCVHAMKLFGVCGALAEVVGEPRQDQSRTWI